MNALEPIEPRTEAASLMEVVSRAASDPNTDVAKLERLLAMYERIKEGEAKATFKAAMVEMKPLLPVIDRNGRIVIKAKGSETVIQSTPYSLWEDIDEAITPILHEHGFVLTFKSGAAADGKVTVTGILSHKNGHEEETTMPLPHDGTGSKNAVQAVGSSMSYGKRYTAILLLNIRTKGEDDDAQSTGKPLAEKSPQPNRITAATKWAKDAEATLAQIKTDKELSEWHRKNANAIAEVRPLNEAAHKRLIEAIAKRSAELSTLTA